MKKLIKESKIIDIEIVLEYQYKSIAADQLIKHPDNISKRRKLNDLKLQILNVTAASAKSIISSNGFEIGKCYQSGKDYTYYIPFTVIKEDGNELPVGIKFRIGNHEMHGDENPIDSTKVIIREFILKGKHYDNSVSIIQTIDKICKELKHGNIKILDEFTY